MVETGSLFSTTIGELEILKLIGKGKSGYSFLASLNKEYLILKKMHDEKAPYYNFASDKTSVEIEAFNKLSELGIRMPELISYNIEHQYLIKEYIDGPTAAEYISEGKINDEIIKQLFIISEKTRLSDINIDFFPTNFVINNNNLYYIDYEINIYTDKWNLENWGIYYWANSRGFDEFLKTGNADAINSDVNKGIPIKEPYQEVVNQWRKNYNARI